MSRVRALFLGTPEIARRCLEALCDDPHFEVVGVISQPDRPSGRKLRLQASAVKSFAESRALTIFTPAKVSDPIVLAQLTALKAEVAIVVAFGQILRQEFLDAFPKKVVNVHASLLPHLRGAAPIQRALIDGDAESGVCLQVMVKKLDAGPVLGARKITVGPEMNAIELYDRCAELGAELLRLELMDYLRGHLTPIPQDEARVTLAPKIDKREGQIDWQRPARDVHNLVRGLAMGPTAFSRLRGKMLKIHRTRVGERQAPPGVIAFVDEHTLSVGCGAGSLELLEVQPESRAKMSITEFLRGHPLKAGDAFDA